MKMQTAWMDRNQLFEAGIEYSQPELIGVLAISRGGSAVVQAPLVSFWVVLRGSADLDAREGRFNLRAGDWLVLEPDSRPSVYADRGSLVLGVTMPASMRARLRQFTHLDLHTGRGTMAVGERRQCMKLWRHTGVFAANGRSVSGSQASSATRSALSTPARPSRMSQPLSPTRRGP